MRAKIKPQKGPYCKPNVKQCKLFAQVVFSRNSGSNSHNNLSTNQIQPQTNLSLFVHLVFMPVYVLAALDRILEKGALERFFRPEGKMNDNVQALPIDRCKLRLYCMRLSDEVIILGNGGVKDARAYEQSKKLNGYVMDLQKFDALVKKEMLMGTITIEGRTIIGIEDKVFRI